MNGSSFHLCGKDSAIFKILPVLNVIESKPVDIPSLLTLLREIGRGDLADSLSDGPTLPIALSAVRRELIKLAIESNEILAGWIAPFPAFPVDSLQSVKRFAMNELSCLRMSMTLGDAIDLHAIGRTLKNIELALHSFGLSMPKGFTVEPSSDYLACKALSLVADLKPKKEARPDILSRNLWIFAEANRGASAKEIVRQHKQKTGQELSTELVYKVVSSLRQKT